MTGTFREILLAGTHVLMLVRTPSAPRFGYVLAHGAGAGMRHPFLEAIAQALFDRGVATLRYEFPYMEEHRKRPDPPPVAVARVREAVQRARAEWPGLPLIAGGKSFGGRMTSTAQAEEPLDSVRGLAFLGFPLHPPRQAFDVARGAPVSGASADAVPPGDAKRIRPVRAHQRRLREARAARHAASD